MEIGDWRENNMQALERIDRKKATLDARRPLSASAVAKLKEHYDVEWTYHSNAIEGSTLTLQETQVVLQHGLTVSGKPLREHLEAINHKHAIDYVETLAREAGPSTERDIRQIHALVLRTIDDEEAGRYRRTQVLITGSAHVPPDPIAVPGLMGDLAAWINGEAAKLHPVKHAALAHFRLVDIHPFIDGNGRTARLLMNLLLFRDGYPLAVIRAGDRLAYYEMLEKAHAGNTSPFVDFVGQAVECSLDVYLAMTEVKS